MKIAVISPSRAAGSTMVATLLGSMLSCEFNKPTIVTYTGERNLGLKNYLDLKDNSDPTRSITQVVKLLELNALNDDQLLEYAVPVTKMLYVFGNGDDTLGRVSHDRLTKFLLKNVGEDINIVVDVTTEVDEDITLEVLKSADLIVYVFTQDAVGINRFKIWRTSEFLKFLEDKSSLFVVNMYNPVISALRDISKSLGLRHQNVLKLSYNPYFIRMGNTGKITELSEAILEKDLRVFDLYYDLQEILQRIAAEQGIVLHRR